MKLFQVNLPSIFTLCLISFLCIETYSQGSCNAPPLGFNNILISNFPGGSNCHNFVKKYLEHISSGGTPIYSAAYSNYTYSVQQIVENAASGWAIDGNSFFNSISSNSQRVYNSSEADYVLYFSQSSNGYILDHSAVKLGNGMFLSKWESCGPVVQHFATDIPYYNNCTDCIRYFKYTPPSANCNFTLSVNDICESCNCAAVGDLFLIKAPSGWMNHQWTISNAGLIVWNFGDYIYIKRNQNHSGWPNNHILVTLSANKPGCSSQTFTTHPLNIPYDCGSGNEFFKIDYNFSFQSLKVKFLDMKFLNEEIDNFVNIKIYNEVGEELFSGLTNTGEIEFSSINGIKKGLYIFAISDQYRNEVKKIWYY